jgi:tRNA pseudouridine32 synthase / 23S rRNA pseudouridine746 synthase
VPSFIPVSPFVVAVIVGAVRDSGSGMTTKEMPSKASCREDITAEQMVSRLLYRDGLMLVIDKPPGIAVHRGPNGGDSLEDYFGALRFGLPRAPALAHRLDRDTSGCLVLGRHRKALAHLGKLFKSGAIGKTYWAVVESGPDTDESQIDLPLGRLDVARGWWMKHDPMGQPAVTKWRVMGRSCSPPPGEKLTWLALEPLTGRTHQLRVHCAAMGWPIVGDAIYGTASRNGGTVLHLHARDIVIPLYKNRAPIRIVAPVPAHMRAALAQCGWREDERRETTPAETAADKL